MIFTAIVIAAAHAAPAHATAHAAAHATVVAASPVITDLGTANGIGVPIVGVMEAVAIRAYFSTPEGKAVLSRALNGLPLKKFCGLLATIAKAANRFEAFVKGLDEKQKETGKQTWTSDEVLAAFFVHVSS